MKKLFLFSALLVGIGVTSAQAENKELEIAIPSSAFKKGVCGYYEELVLNLFDASLNHAYDSRVYKQKGIIKMQIEGKRGAAQETAKSIAPLIEQYKTLRCDLEQLTNIMNCMVITVSSNLLQPLKRNPRKKCMIK